MRRSNVQRTHEERIVWCRAMAEKVRELVSELSVNDPANILAYTALEKLEKEADYFERVASELEADPNAPF